ncbi:hypothetical protein EG329_005911 [Mollisiaceae sp. DMI_Dod_QoI]|nr:hypothetical protein EG329_005911 [Helotiales sp. DMI_Dod_QoI]
MPPAVQRDLNPEHLRILKYRVARYREVHALLIGLEGDSAKAVHELDDLDRVMRQDYAMITRKIEIPLTGGGVLDAELNEFHRIYDAPDILLVVFFDARERDFQGVDFIVKLGPFMNGLSDLVALFDQQSATPGGELEDIVSNNPNKIEIIRTWPGHAAAEPEHRSFTVHTMRALRKLSSEIHVSLNALSLCINFSICGPESTNTPNSENGGPMARPRHPQATIHFSVNPKGPRQQVILIPFRLQDLRDVRGLVSAEDQDQHRWGPLGPLALGWEKRIDNTDSQWRPYYYHSSADRNYWTRPWHSVYMGELDGTWNARQFAAYGTKALGQKLLDNPILMRDVTLNPPVEDPNPIEPETAPETYKKWADALEKHDREAFAEQVESFGLPSEFMSKERERVRTDIHTHVYYPEARGTGSVG